ncbi:hypothetical protein BGZ99_004167 [Dissophora globulifera]|uniref:N-acetyltransferase domain-containing protein n=1 Tax=Dissophora globulifera TaxID=979702 RepID=A0A9P6RMF8_9FUNG|nr:hypothetical protein BGZ99_004167 [Dissophora globulifera]
MSNVNESAIRIRPYAAEDEEQVSDTLVQGFRTVTDPVFFRRIKHYSTLFSILIKSVLFSSLLELALTAYFSSKIVASSPLSFAGLFWDTLNSFLDALMRPESTQSLIKQFLRPSFILIWVVVTLVVAAFALVDIHRWAVSSNTKYVENCFEDDLGDIHAYYQTQSLTNGRKNRSQFWVACLDSHPQLVLGCIALDDNWAHEEYMKKRFLARGRKNAKFEAPSKTDGEMRRLSVHPNYQRLGISKRLIDAVVEYATKSGFKTLSFTTTYHQPIAIANYIRYGFVKVKSSKRAKFIDLWHGTMNLYATDEDKEEQHSRRGEMLREIGAL